MGDTGIRRSRVEIALDAFTPVDESVYESLDAAARRRHADDLAKRLSVAAELSRVGASRLVDEVLTASNRPDVVADLDSLVEFGRLPEELTPLQHEQVGRAQIRDEILHFDRIMDLDALAGGRDLKPRRVQVWDTGPLAAAERLLTLTYERRVLRGDEPPEWLHVGAVQPGRLRNVGRAGAVLVRDGAPQLVAAAVGTNSDACLRRLERYCGKHPLGVAIGLLDYEMFLNGEPECALVAGAASDWFGERTVKVWACGDALVFTAFRDGHLQRISAVHRLAGGRLGDRATEYGRTEVSLDRPHGRRTAVCWSSATISAPGPPLTQARSRCRWRLGTCMRIVRWDRSRSGVSTSAAWSSVRPPRSTKHGQQSSGSGSRSFPWSMTTTW